MRKKRFEPEGSEKYKKVNNNIKRYTKKAKENWIGEQWIETEKYLRKNNNKKAYHLVKDLKPVWNDKSISLSSKIRRMHSLVTSIFLYAFESWTFTAELQRRIQAMKMRYYRKISCISYKVRVTNEEVRAKIQLAIGPHDDLVTIEKRRKLQWYCHVSHSTDLAKTILQGIVKGGRRQGGQRKRWEDNIREWTGLEFGKSQRAVENREKWKKMVANSSVVPQRPSRLRD